MTEYLFHKAKFVTTAIQPKDYPVLKNPSGHLLPEIAVAGRSNVGKSSLLNHLFQQKGLVKTSSAPGKTQMINFFAIEDQLSFVDLPGYGYAQVPDSVRKQWGPMVQNYLQKRESLKLILLLFDIRRMPNDDDFQFLEWVIFNQKPMILVLTKVDKVKKAERVINTKKILDAFNAENLHHTYYSTTENVGRLELIKKLIAGIEEE